jgi:hypothetical protein
MNIDLELLVLLLGIKKVSGVIETSEEALHGKMHHFLPENQKFFQFLKDCLLSYIKKIGPKAAEERLEISSYVIDAILQESQVKTKSKPKEPAEIRNVEDI